MANNKNNQKTNRLAQICYIILVLLIVGCAMSIHFDFMSYTTTLNSAPFYVFILARLVEFGIPIIVDLAIINVYEHKYNKNKNTDSKEVDGEV